MENLKDRLLEGCGLNNLKKLYKTSGKKIKEAIKNLEEEGRLTSGFFKRFMEREKESFSSEYFKENRDAVLSLLLKGKSVHQIRQELNLGWLGVNEIKRKLIEEKAFSEDIYGVNVVEFLHQWPRGMSIKEMERQKISHRRKLRKCRDWLVENKWIRPR